ncbi:Hypothetical protein R9X50_00138000 [Acrodontium crateriforme]|uniref:F-box domain-containing protein n=1 Tax=Acrodontium crateriforme TaxID=150365 RepID=A0AAQ3RA11_9PEZI|nr:Hypothetical protein R9X50_00138000 [Acrodontium crateriforme]
MQTPFNSSRLQRPSLADYRPQTAPLFHTHPIEEERDQKSRVQDHHHQDDDDSDDQSTPRASLAGLTIQRRLSRDDTATDSHHPIFNSTHFFDASKPSHRPLPAAASKQSHEDLRSQRLLARTSFVTWTNSSASDPSSNPSKTASLGRRWSRTKESFSHMRESVVKPLMRRSSVAMDTSASSSSAPTPRPVATSTVHPPLSPSKRGAKNADDRPKKLQARGILDGRKDTPAPSSYGMPRPMQPLPFQLGGENARKAAAQSNSSGSLGGTRRAPSPSTSRNVTRGRMSSNPNAYDSGADLSSCSDSHHEDQDMDGDINMEECLEAEEQESGPYARDFVQVLPSEISLQIFEYLDAHDLLTAQNMSPQWKVLANEMSVWRAAYMRKYGREVIESSGKPIPPPIQVGGAGLGRTNKPTQPWNKMYRARVELEKNWRKGADSAGKAVYLSGHTDSVYCVQFDEEKIITGSRDRTIRVWDINTFQCIRVIGGPNVRPTLGPKTLRTVDYPAFHLATASVNGTAYGDSIYRVPSQWHDASILCLQYDSEILVTGSSDSDLLVWDIHTYEPIRRLKKHTGGVLDVALDSKYIVSCSKDSRIIVWDRETYEPIGELTGHRGPVNAVQLRGHQLVSASGDGIARLWDLNTMKLVKEFSAKERGLAAVEFSEDMQYVLAGGNDHITYKFNVETGKEVQQFTGHSQLVRSLWLDSANSRVVSGSYDLDLRVYDFNTGEEIWRAEEWTTSWMLAAKSDYRRIVATSQDGRILLVDFGLYKGGQDDGQKIKDVDLLRGIEETTAVMWRNPWTREII